MISNKGYNSGGIYKTRIGNSKHPIYDIWVQMVRRCYSIIKQTIQPTYIDCTVCDDWLNFQVFAKWYDENKIEGFALDKDILFKGNKIYSPHTCCFVPQEINNLFVGPKARGKYIIGVRKRKNRYIAQISINNIKIHLGSFLTEIEAFNSYKEYKEKYIKELANKYKGIITINSYNALMNYIVESTD